jgi:hypothetical protein
MGCAFVYGTKRHPSKHFEMSAVKEACEARGVSEDKLFKKIPTLLKCQRAQTPIDYLTQIETAQFLNLPITFFYHTFNIDQKSKIMMCGEGIRACAICGHVADFLCDAPIGDGRTCDLPLCKDHKYHRPDVSIDTDYCPHHKFIGKEIKNYKVSEGK